MKKILQKIIAESGYCSRRAAEDLIKRGQVKLNNILAKPGDMADENDQIKVRGKILNGPQEKVYLKMNKPVGYTCTNREFKNEKNIFTLAGKLPKGVFTVGRLDKNSRGLILITNDGDLNLKLTHPRLGHEKVYEVKINQETDEKLALKIKNNFLKGIPFDLEEGIARAKRVDHLGGNQFKIVLTEGKKRQIRRMFEALKIRVADLKRVSFAGVELDRLAEGKWGKLTKNEIERLKKL